MNEKLMKEKWMKKNKLRKKKTVTTNEKTKLIILKSEE